MKPSPAVILAFFVVHSYSCVDANAGIIIDATANPDATQVTYTYSGTFDTGVLKVGNGGGNIGTNSVSYQPVFSNSLNVFTSNSSGNPNYNNFEAAASSTFVTTGFQPFESNGSFAAGSTNNRPFRVAQNQGAKTIQLEDNFTLGDVLSFAGSWTATQPKDRTSGKTGKSAFEATGSWTWTFTGNGDSDTVVLNFSSSTSSAVPEPSTALVMGLLGIVGFAGNRRRRRQVSVA